MLLTYCNSNYLDRNAIAQARLNNLEKDLKLVGSQYNTCISILFVGLVRLPFKLPVTILTLADIC